MKVLLACEESQAVCKAFRAKGHMAYSCDFLECSGGRSDWHLRGDVRRHIFNDWDIMIAFPPCTYLCNSGVRWLKNNPIRYEKMLQAAEFFKMLLGMEHIPKICLENPIPHYHAKLPAYSQIIHPWQFGHGEKKATCLWLKGLKKLKPSRVVSGREQKIFWMPPGNNRSLMRSKTYSGIAEAMAEQWG
jgi:hypothetical protein